MDKTSEIERINEIIDVIMQVARGDYSIQLKLSNKNDDLDSLAVGINMMIEDFGENAKEIERNQGLLLEKIKDLKKNELATLNIMEDFQKTINDLEKAKVEINDLNRNLEQKVKERTEKINRLLRQKDEFIQQMGHDLKNPLGPLVTLLPLLKNACKDPKYCEMLDVILRNVNYMKNLVQKTLDLAQLSSPNTQLKFEKIDLKEQVDSVIKDNKLSLDQISAKVYNKVPEDIQIDADTLRLQEVLNNLISNAVKYRSHECLIEIDAVQTDTDIKVSVKDNGIGMNENQLSHVFTEFYKADPARHDFTSTGLGLSICKRIIEMHGGNIGVSSEGLNRGTTFFFTIPNRNSVTVNVPYQGTSHIIERISN